MLIRKKKQLSAIKENVITEIVPSAITALDSDLPTNQTNQSVPTQPVVSTNATVADPNKELRTLKDALRKKNLEIKKLQDQTRNTFSNPPRPPYLPPDHIYTRTKEGYKPKELLDRQCQPCRNNERLMKRCSHCRRHSVPNKMIAFSDCQDPMCLDSKRRRTPRNPQKI